MYNTYKTQYVYAASLRHDTHKTYIVTKTILVTKRRITMPERIESEGEAMTMLTPEARAARAKYMREWRKKNPEKQKEYNARKWENKAAKIKEEREAASNEAAQ